MNFTSEYFLTWMLPVFLVLYYLMPTVTLKNILLLAGSLYFYYTSEPLFLYLLLASALGNYLLARIITATTRPGAKRLLLILAIFLNVAFLALFKYTDFIIDTINRLFSTQIPLAHLPLPLGISFFTFQAMSYVIDIYHGRYRREESRSLLDFALYLTMFPQLVAGPIVRYQDVYQDIGTREITITQISTGIQRFIFGLSKKILLANSFAVVADTVFALDPYDAGSALLFLGAVAYSLQIYFDFSGYSDMAIGIGHMLGFAFPENFNKPYLARSITDFWRRWHITLSSWFRDYLYFPLGGSKTTLGRTNRNLLIVWILTGLWHGANWTFVLWGLLYFLFISLEKAFKYRFGMALEEKLPPILTRLYTLFIVMILWVIFRSESITDALRYISAMMDPANNGMTKGQALFYFKEYTLAFTLGILLATNFFQRIAAIPNKSPLGRSVIEGGRIILSAILLVLCLIYIAKGGYNPFIYFNF